MQATAEKTHELKTRIYKPEDYETLASWWDKHPQWKPVPEEWLPKVGFVVDSDGSPICAGFLYFTNSTIAWLEYIVSDPDSDKETRSEAVDVLINQLTTQAIKVGFKVHFTSVGNPAFQKRLVEKHQYEVGDTNVTQLFRRFA